MDTLYLYIRFTTYNFVQLNSLQSNFYISLKVISLNIFLLLNIFHCFFLSIYNLNSLKMSFNTFTLFLHIFPKFTKRKKKERKKIKLSIKSNIFPNKNIIPFLLNLIAGLIFVLLKPRRNLLNFKKVSGWLTSDQPLITTPKGLVQI